MRVDPAEFRKTEWIRFYDEFPCTASRQTWRILAENRPDSNLAGVAQLRLAQLDARVGDIERAITKSETAISKLDRVETRAAKTQTVQSGVLKGVWARQQPETTLNAPFCRTE